MYEDEGYSYNYEKGAFSTIEIGWEDASRTLTIGNRQGSFPGMPANRESVAKSVGDGGSDGPTIQYDGSLVKINL